SDGRLVLRSAGVLVRPNVLYLPMLHRAEPGIYGRVTQNGAPAAGVSLELRFYNGSGWYTQGFATTDAKGKYLFSNPPNLGPGQRYYVLFRNTEQTAGRLWVWATPNLTAYASGSTTVLADFDIADIELVAPEPEEVVDLPYRFRWTRRPAT